MDLEQFTHQLTKELSDILEEKILTNVISVFSNAISRYDVTFNTRYPVIYNSYPELLKLYLSVKKVEGLSSLTLKNYYLLLRKMFMVIGKPANEILPNDIRMFLYVYNESAKRPVSNRTLDKYREYILHFFSWAYTNNYLEKDISKNIMPIRYEKKERQFLTQTELELIRNACQTLREKLIIEFLYSTGCRVSELINVRFSDMNLQEHSVHVVGKGNKHRVCFFNARAYVLIQERFKSVSGPDDYLVVSEKGTNQPLSRYSVESIVGEIASRVKSINKPITPHVFRHTMATTALRNGMPIEDISRLLGHASINTTMIYAKTSVENVKLNHSKFVI